MLIYGNGGGGACQPKPARPPRPAAAPKTRPPTDTHKQLADTDNGPPPPAPPGYRLPYSRIPNNIRLATLKFTQQDGVATITLNRPAAGNRINPEMAEELRTLAAELAADDALRLVVLTAVGDCFSTGRAGLPGGLPGTLTDGDSGLPGGGLPDDDAGGPLSAIRALPVASAVAAIPAPVLAALNGDATDQGLELALAADLRIAVGAARLGFAPLSSAAFPGDGGTQRLPRLVGPAWARDLLLTGRLLDAAEAHRIGLVNYVADGRDELAALTAQLTRQICAAGPLAARYAKEAATHGPELTLEQGLGLETDLNVLLQSTKDRAEGIASFLERRPPQFTGQ